MAASLSTCLSAPQGYQLEFIDSVKEEYKCKKCCLVARNLNITDCCGESYCKVCIDTIQQDALPCPVCGSEDFDTLKQVKYQQKIASLQVHCSMKQRGCDWSGELGHLDTHLDPHHGDCEYTDVDCPLKCDKKITKKNIDQHTTKECVKRDYVCPHCSFKAIYEIVCNIHWPECTYYPLRCPNFCGVTCERDDMEYHMKICPLEEVECEFKFAGCENKFKREKEEEHMKENNQKHLTIMAATSLKMSMKLQEQEKKLMAQERKFEEKLTAQKYESDERLKAIERIYSGELNTLKRNHDIAEKILLQRNFQMRNFSTEKERNISDDWKSPPMYTHWGGYKFCIGVDANGCNDTRGDSVNVDMWALRGEFDDQLKWPFIGTFTIELINHNRDLGYNRKVTTTMSWKKPIDEYTYVGPFSSSSGGKNIFMFIKHYLLTTRKTQFLLNDSLYFCITDITIT